MTESFERGYDAGNYASAYETEDVVEAWNARILSGREVYEGFILGFFSSYELDEIPDEHREEVDYLRGIYED